MKPDHDLSGLFQYAATDEWSGCLEEALGDHFGVAMLEFDLEHEEISDLLGEHWAMTLWGCAFEDLLTREFEPDGANIADDYLNRRGWKETPGARAYIRALRKAVMSLYEVSEVSPARSFLARDLIRGGDPVLVSEKSATQTLNAWDRIAARIVPIGEKHILAGGLLPFTMEAADNLIEGLRKAEGADSDLIPPPVPEWRHDLGMRWRHRRNLEGSVRSRCAEGGAVALRDLIEAGLNGPADGGRGYGDSGAAARPGGVTWAARWPSERSLRKPASLGPCLSWE